MTETSTEMTPETTAPETAQGTLIGGDVDASKLNTSAEESAPKSLISTEERPVESIPEWVKEKIPEKFRMDPNLSKYKDMNSFIEGHLSLAKKIGEKFEMPAEDSTQEQWDAWYDKVGRPKNAADYKFDSNAIAETIPMTPEDVAGLKSAMHSLGLSQKQFDGIMAMYTESAKAQAEAGDAERAKVMTEHQMESVTALQKEWGHNFEANLKIANQTLDKYGLSDTIVKLGLGNDANAVKLGYELAQKTGETMLNEFNAAPSSFAETVKALKESDAFKRANHPEHKAVVKQIEDLYMRQYGR